MQYISQYANKKDHWNLGTFPHSGEIWGCLVKEATFDLDLEEQVKF